MSYVYDTNKCTLHSNVCPPVKFVTKLFQHWKYLYFSLHIKLTFVVSVGCKRLVKQNEVCNADKKLIFLWECWSFLRITKNDIILNGQTLVLALWIFKNQWYSIHYFWYAHRNYIMAANFYCVCCSHYYSNVDWVETLV